jgi:putative membrane protein
VGRSAPTGVNRVIVGTSHVEDMGVEDRPADPDSRARTHLANERTFLAWLRTGMSLVALGLAAAHFLNEDIDTSLPVTTILALFLVLAGIAVTLAGGWRYRTSRDQIDRGAYRASLPAVAIGSGIGLAAGFLSLILVFLL